MKSAKSELHEHLQRHQLPPATFKCLPAAGVSGGFTCDVTIIGSSSGARTFSSQNCHPKKKQAEDDVARVALGELVPVAEKPELGQPVALAATAGATEMSAAASNKEPPTAAEAAPSAMQNPPFIGEGAITAPYNACAMFSWRQKSAPKQVCVMRKLWWTMGVTLLMR